MVDERRGLCFILTLVMLVLMLFMYPPSWVNRNLAGGAQYYVPAHPRLNQLGVDLIIHGLRGNLGGCLEVRL